MEAIGGIKGVIALIEISSRIICLCGDYAYDVKRAREDIEKLCDEVMTLRDVVQEVQKRTGAILSNSGTSAITESLTPTIRRCTEELECLLHRLIPGKGRKAMRKLGLRALTWPFKTRDVMKVVDNLERQKTTFILVLNLDQSNNIGISEQRRQTEEQSQKIERRRAQRHRNEEAHHRKEVANHISGSQDWRLEMRKETIRARRQNLLDKLSNFDYSRALKSACRQRQQGTGEWLVESPDFKEWQLRRGSSLLWCSGKLGSGKTILTAYAVIHLARRYSRQGRVAYFFCQFDDERSLTATAILSSFIKQLLDPETMSSTIETRLTSILKFGSPDLHDLEILIQEILSQSSTRYLVIDAIDECSKAEQDALAKVLQRVMSVPSGKTKLYISSRDTVSRQVKRIHPTINYIKMNSKAIESDMKLFIQRTVQEKVDDGELAVGNPYLLRKIQDSLVRGADGMFLWVAFQLQDVCNQKCDKDIYQVLENLPRDLPETYKRLLCRIDADGNKAIAARIFRWLACAKRPMSLEELRDAIAVEPLQPYSMPERLVNDISRLGPWCQGLAVVNEEYGTLEFTHYSVQTFLLGDCRDDSLGEFHFQLEDADREAGEICVTYLNFNDFKTQLTKRPKAQSQSQISSDVIVSRAIRDAGYGNVSVALSRVARLKKGKSNVPIGRLISNVTGNSNASSAEPTHLAYPFLDYASEFWLSHTTAFSEERLQMWNLWKSTMSLEQGIARAPWTSEQFKDRDNIVTNTILELRHVALLRCIQNSDAPLPDPELDYLLAVAAGRAINSLVCAIINGHELTTERLSAPLKKAAQGGHLDMVEKLLAENANVNSRGDGWTALQAAAKGGHLHIVEILLAERADVNAAASRNGGRTALQAACASGYLDIVDMLLAAKAHVNAAPARRGGMTALQAAAAGGYLDIVEVLIAANADVNAAPAKHGGHTALQAAAGGGHFDVVERLLMENTDVNALASAGNKGQTALQAAASGGYLDVVEMLLAAGAEVNTDAPNGAGTALQAAAAGGHLAVVDRLLVANADINLRGADGWTVLQAAAKGGHIGVVERLLTLKADVNAPAAIAKNRGRTALQAAAERGNFEVVERLLAAKANINEADEWGGQTALQLAAGNGHLEVVEMLLMAGANVNAADEWGGRTALQAAARGGHLEVVETLLAAKANINAADEWGGQTALQAAAQGGHFEVVESLRNRGAR